MLLNTIMCAVHNLAEHAAGRHAPEAQRRVFLPGVGPRVKDVQSQRSGELAVEVIASAVQEAQPVPRVGASRQLI